VLGRTLAYQAAPGEANELTVTRSVETYRIVDRGSTIVAAAGCTSVAPNEVTCASEEVRVIRIQVLDGNDSVSLSTARPSIVRGGEGDDTLEGGEGSDLLFGEGGDDTLKGGTGIDLLDGGPGGDQISGGTGVVFPFPFFEEEDLGELEVELDIAVYERRVNPVIVDFDAAADDGESGEGDNVGTDVEGIVGGAGDDTLVGDARNNVLIGQRGSDTLMGGGGQDFLEGGGDDDVLSGGRARDGLAGGPGRDELRGGSGRDELDGGGGRDRLFGQGAGDFIFARDRRRDLVNGGAGRDCAFVDRRLDIVRRVECLLPPRPDRLTGSSRAALGSRLAAKRVHSALETLQR
jgi:RTX calcium-binding nonapeptide repeat (4 copies)